MKFDHNKYFKNALRRIIQPELKKRGFSKRGTLSFVRRTDSDIIQVINFQRSKWDSKNFYVNSGNLPLHEVRDRFFPEIGNRISSYGILRTNFNFQSKIIGDISLKDIKKSIQEKVLPYFDYTNSLENIHAFSLYATKNKEQYPFLMPFAYRERTYLPADKNRAFIYLCLGDYESALEIYKGIQRREFNPQTRIWNYYQNNDYDSIIEEIQTKKFNEIEARIENNVQQSLINLKFDKLKIYKSPEITLEEVIKKLETNNHLSKRRSTFPYYYYKIFTRNDLEETFNQLKNHLKQKYKLEIREHEIIAYVNEKFSFYLAINEADYVEEENVQIESDYDGKKDISWIKSCNKRIDFWSDDDKNMDYFNEHLFIMQHWQNLDLEILYGDKLLFFDEL